tara:strand:- start:154 stop:465 length:312 start_codon:yes stop_codon:yes gene_type:complete
MADAPCSVCLDESVSDATLESTSRTWSHSRLEPRLCDRCRKAGQYTVQEREARRLWLKGPLQHWVDLYSDVTPHATKRLLFLTCADTQWIDGGLFGRVPAAWP